MCRRKESKGEKRKGNFDSCTHSTGRDSSFLSFFASLSSVPVPLSLLWLFAVLSSPRFFLPSTILTSEARKEIRVAPWHRLSVHFTRFAVGAITYEFPLSSGVRFCLRLLFRVRQFQPLSSDSPTLSEISCHGTLKNRTHFSEHSHRIPPVEAP